MFTALQENKYISYDQGDQGFLNAYFSSWYNYSSNNRLPFKYNVLQTIIHLYPPAWKIVHDTRQVHILHFSGDLEM
jgi:hypothetical protein